MTLIFRFLISFSILMVTFHVQASTEAESIRKQTKAAISEKNRALKSSQNYVGRLLQSNQIASKSLDVQNCTIGGGNCNFDEDCCSSNCFSGKCQAGVGGCTIGGGNCSFDNECCSDNCHSGVCQAGTGGCSAGGGACSFDNDCCSDNCYSGVCQSSCTGAGENCRYDHECCAGNCNRSGYCGIEVPGCF